MFSFASLPFIKPELKNLDSKNPLHWLALGFGSGLSPKAPGTFGTLAAIPLWFLIKDLPISLYLTIIVVGYIAGIWICNSATKAIGKPDHGAIVWDEIIGFWITMIFAPSGWVSIIAGFVLFRFFDILKPWPISFFDKKIHGGNGIMLDDVVAGIFALICLQALVYYLP